MRSFLLLITAFVFCLVLSGESADAQYWRPQRPQQVIPGYWRVQPGYPGTRPRTYGQPKYINPGQPKYVTPSPTRTRKPSTSHIPADAVTPEEAHKRFKRPKTNPPPKFDPESIYPRIAGEFEQQNAIAISLSEMLPGHKKVFLRVAELTHDHVQLLVLFNKTDQVVEALKVLQESDQPLDHVHFMRLKLDTVWLRDFGPILAEQPDGLMCFDFFYNGQRPVDDNFPKEWAGITSVEHNAIPWTIQGGNLLSNGQGLALTTSRIFEDNKVNFPPAPGVDRVTEQRTFVLQQFKAYTNLKRLVVLEPLHGESTRHVDMFASFVSPEEVLVATVDGRRDPVNAAILERNVQRLRNVKVDGSPLKVRRIPMPVRRGTIWSPYTNVIIANKLVMMPVMSGDDRSMVKKAVNVWRRALPDHRVATVDVSTMEKLQGALHCMSIHIPEYAPLPKKKMVSYERATKWAVKKELIAEK